MSSNTSCGDPFLCYYTYNNGNAITNTLPTTTSNTIYYTNTGYACASLVYNIYGTPVWTSGYYAIDYTPQPTPTPPPLLTTPVVPAPTLKEVDLLGGLTKDEIFEIYQNGQRDIKQSIELNSTQLSVAKTEWKRRLACKAEIENDKRKHQVVVDDQDLD